MAGQVGPEKKKRSYSSLSDSQFNWYHWVFQWISIKLVQIYVTFKYNFRVRGKENQPKGFQSYIVACNHISSLDPPLLSLILDYQPVAYIAKQELYENPLMRWYLYLMSSFSVNR